MRKEETRILLESIDSQPQLFHLLDAIVLDCAPALLRLQEQKFDFRTKFPVRNSLSKVEHQLQPTWSNAQVGQLVKEK